MLNRIFVVAMATIAFAVAAFAQSKQEAKVAVSEPGMVASATNTTAGGTVAITRIPPLQRKDLRDAKRWCKFRTDQLDPSDSDYKLFRQYTDDLNAKNFRSSMDAPSGMYYGLVKEFANAWHATHHARRPRWW